MMNELMECHDVVVNDSVSVPDDFVRRMVIETGVPVISEGGFRDYGITHSEEAAKVFRFLNDCISYRTYDSLMFMMRIDNGIFGMEGVYADMISDTERTLVTLKRVEEAYLPESVMTMVKNEVDLLERKVSDLTILMECVDGDDDI